MCMVLVLVETRDNLVAALQYMYLRRSILVVAGGRSPLLLSSRVTTSPNSREASGADFIKFFNPFDKVYVCKVLPSLQP